VIVTSIIVACSGCRQRNQVYLARMDSAICANCKGSLAQPVTERLISDSEIRRILTESGSEGPN
jgi:hypothetical protein